MKRIRSCSLSYIACCFLPYGACCIADEAMCKMLRYCFLKHNQSCNFFSSSSPESNLNKKITREQSFHLIIRAEVLLLSSRLIIRVVAYIQLFLYVVVVYEMQLSPAAENFLVSQPKYTVFMLLTANNAGGWLSDRTVGRTMLKFITKHRLHAVRGDNLKL